MGQGQSGARGFVIIDFGPFGLGKGCVAQKVGDDFECGMLICLYGDFGPHWPHLLAN
jgi:hypothetical protein